MPKKNMVVSKKTKKYSELDALVNQGFALHQQGKFNEAQVIYEQVLDIEPDRFNVLQLLGALLLATKQYPQSVEVLSKALRINSNHAVCYSNRGSALAALKRSDAALADFNKAISLVPDYAMAYFNRGIILTELKQYDAAITDYDNAINLKQNWAEAHYNRANILQILINLDSALASYDRAIRLKPDLVGAHASRGDLMRFKFQYIDALEATKTALQLDPQLDFALQNYATILAYLSDYSEVCQYSDRALSLASQIELVAIQESRLYLYIYHPDLTARQIVDEHIKWGSQFAALGQGDFAGHDRTPKRRLKIGYVSPDFRGHTCRFYFEPLFSQHNHTEFELFAYSNVLIEDEHTQRMKPYFDHWRTIVSVSDEAAAQMIKDDQIDILVDACGHMMDTRLEIFAHKPAPIQVTWLGAAWTTGLPQMDYVLFDPYMAPPEAVASEQIIRLPRTWTAFRPGDKARQASVKLSPAAMNGYVTFGYSGRTERLNHRVFTVWGRILKRLPQARLVLDFVVFADPKTAQYYQGFLQRHGIDTSRVVMRHSENIFEGLGDIDILLDSFPHSGGTMLFDAVWMGVPVITLASDRPVGRIGTSLMTNLGLADWVAIDEQAYEDKAVSFAQDMPALIQLRAGMRTRMQSSPVMDEAGFAGDVQDAFKGMWQTWVGGQADRVEDR